MNKVMMNAPARAVSRRGMHNKMSVHWLPRHLLVDGIICASDRDDESMGNMLTSIYMKLLNEEDTTQSVLSGTKVPAHTMLRIKQYLQKYAE